MATSRIDDVHDVLVKAIEDGATYKMASWAAGVNESTFSRWMKRGEQHIKDGILDTDYSKLCKDIKRARYDRDLKHIAVIENCAKQGQWQASAWWLERTNQHQFGRNADELKKAEELEQKIEKLSKLVIEKLGQGGINHDDNTETD